MDSILVNTLYQQGYYLSLTLIPIVMYFVFFKGGKNDNRRYKGWFYPIKFYVAKKEVQRYQEKYRKLRKIAGNKFDIETNIPSVVHSNFFNFYGSDQKGNSLIVCATLGAEKLAELRICLKLADGNSYTLPEENNILHTTLTKEQWKIKGFSIEVLEPFRKLRIVFNGLLRNVGHEHYGTVEQVQFNFIFTCAGAPFFFPEDVEKSLLTDALVTDVWRDGSWSQNLVNQHGCDQFGAMLGFVKGESHQEPVELNLATCRSHFKGMDDRLILKRAIRLFIVDEYGNLIYLVIKAFRDGCSQMNYGWVYQTDLTQFPIKDVDVRIEDIGSNEIIPELITLHIKTKVKTYKCVIHLNESQSVKSCSSMEYFGYDCYSAYGDCDMNENQAKALIEFWYKKQGDKVFIPKRLLHEKLEKYSRNILVSNIQSAQSEILELTGGKGASLALLSSLNSKEFIVPDGCIVTVNAYRLQVQSNENLKQSLEAIKDICCGKSNSNLEDACDYAMEQFKHQELSNTIKTSIIEYIENNRDDSGVGWAVRSSAIGEDSEDLSAAGQNETFLGCRTQEEILKAVVSCWASLFSVQSVKYRWQHGSPILTDMAVVIQKMVPSDSAGVLFTWHPTNSNPSQMVITSNFGLGETVVSGESDPDTFVLNKTWDNKLCILEKHAGHKNKVLKMSNEGIVTDQSSRDSWSLTDKQILTLGKVGVTLEEMFGNPRDIEWAFSNGKLYLLQSRPITTVSAWTDSELQHEMDNAILTDKSVFTVANVKEVIPHGVSVLSITTIMRCIDYGIQITAHEHYDPYCLNGIPIFLNNVFIDVVNGIHRNAVDKVSINSLMLDLAIFGHPVLDEKLNDLIKKRRGTVTKLQLASISARMFYYAYTNKKSFENAKLEAHKMEVLLTFNQNDTPLTILNKIDLGLNSLNQIAVNHSKTSSGSVFYQIVTMNILLEGREELTTEVYEDFAVILSSCEDVVSAEIPVFIAKISEAIRKIDDNSQFVNIPSTDGVEWLKHNCQEGYDIFQEFMKIHGHRSASEFDLMEKSWSDDPSSIISMVQLNVKHGKDYVKNKLSVKQVADSLTSIKHSRTKNAIKFVLKRMRTAVGVREKTKCELVRAINFLRLAYRHLGLKLVEQGMLPSIDLMYHLTHYELRQLIEDKNSSFVSKALRRQRLYPNLKKLNFPEINYGRPVLIEHSEEHIITTCDNLVKGTPASAGIAKARACVLNSLNEIDQLQKGDILITYSTDISWSPYFPMLSGIVTELGGLVSHGAVVAREYGLPCIVGVQDARRYFKTGDVVFINGGKGTIGHVQED